MSLFGPGPVSLTQGRDSLEAGWDERCQAVFGVENVGHFRAGRTRGREDLLCPGYPGLGYWISAIV